MPLNHAAIKVSSTKFETTLSNHPHQDLKNVFLKNSAFEVCSKLGKVCGLANYIPRFMVLYDELFSISTPVSTSLAFLLVRIQLTE